MPRPTAEPTITGAASHLGKDAFTEEHPAFGQISVSHPTGSGRTLFDSDIKHSDTVTLVIKQASRTRAMHRDWISESGPRLIEVEMSQSQWAAMVSSRSATSCTIRATQNEPEVPGLPFESRLAMTADEVAEATRKAVADLSEAVALVEDKPTKANLRSLRAAVDNLPGNLRFAAEKLTEHTENVVTKAQADIEAAVDSRAAALGLSAADRPVLSLGEASTTITRLED